MGVALSASQTVLAVVRPKFRSIFTPHLLAMPPVKGECAQERAARLQQRAVQLQQRATYQRVVAILKSKPSYITIVEQTLRANGAFSDAPAPKAKAKAAAKWATIATRPARVAPARNGPLAITDGAEAEVGAAPDEDGTELADEPSHTADPDTPSEPPPAGDQEYPASERLPRGASCFANFSISLLKRMLAAAKPVAFSEFILKALAKRGSRDIARVELNRLLEFVTNMEDTTLISISCRYEGPLLSWTKATSIALGRRGRDIQLPVDWSSNGVYEVRFLRDSRTCKVINRLKCRGRSRRPRCRRPI